MQRPKLISDDGFSCSTRQLATNELHLKESETAIPTEASTLTNALTISEDAELEIGEPSATRQCLQANEPK